MADIPHCSSNTEVLFLLGGHVTGLRSDHYVLRFDEMADHAISKHDAPTEYCLWSDKIGR